MAASHSRPLLLTQVHRKYRKGWCVGDLDSVAVYVQADTPVIAMACLVIEDGQQMAMVGKCVECKIRPRPWWQQGMKSECIAG